MASLNNSNMDLSSNDDEVIRVDDGASSVGYVRKTNDDSFSDVGSVRRIGGENESDYDNSSSFIDQS